MIPKDECFEPGWLWALSILSIATREMQLQLNWFLFIGARILPDCQNVVLSMVIYNACGLRASTPSIHEHHPTQIQEKDTRPPAYIDRALMVLYTTKKKL